MIKAVVIGDVHCTADSISDCQSLIELIKTKAQEKSCETLIFLGDLFHTHSVIDSNVLNFWKQTFDDLLSEKYIIYALVGNHDRSSAGSDSGPHALEVFKGYNDNLKIVDSPIQIDKNIWAIPHYYHNDFFLSTLNNVHQASTIFTHATFDGSQYDNGFYAPDGIDVSNYPHTFISGHLHTQHSLNNFIYTGSPRWLTASDANNPKSIWYFEILGKNIIAAITRAPIA